MSSAPALPSTPAQPVLELFSLQGQTACVSGATRGIGSGCAIALAQAGASIILLQRDESNTKTRDAIRALGRKAEIVIADMADTERVKTVWADVETAAGRPVEILVHAAGIQRRSPATDFSESDWDDVLAVNLKSYWLLSQAAGRSMVKQSYGRIILLGSLMTFQGGVYVPASKGAIGSLVKALANEWTKHGVTVNALAPGYIATDMTSAIQNDPERLKSINDRIPAGRWGAPNDFAGPTVFLASSAAQYVTGTVLAVDGGWLGR